MPLTALHLESRLLSQIAPGNPEEFYRLLTEADERLLNSGKWRWTRERVVLPVDNGIVRLPDGYESIVAARLNGIGKNVGWEEREYLEDESSCMCIQGCSAQIQDKGLFNGPADSMTVIIEDLDFSLKVVPTNQILNGKLIYVSDRSVTSPPPPNGDFASIVWTGSAWTAFCYRDGIVCGVYSVNDDTETPFDLVGWSGALIYPPMYSVRDTAIFRSYSISDTSIEEIEVLARFESRTTAAPSDIPVCQSFPALKQAMLSIIYEENNDLERSMGYMSIALDTLNKQESSYRGNAKKVYNPKLFGPIPRRSKHNFL